MVPPLPATTQEPIHEANTHSCPCGKSYATDKGLKQHQRRYCRYEGVQAPASIAVPANSCQMCEREFATFAGLRQHQRLAHPADYNAGLENEAVVRRVAWNPIEILRMAKAESKFTGLHTNAHLGRLLGRDRHVVKVKRRESSYKDLVSKLRAEAEEASSSSNSEDDVFRMPSPPAPIPSSSEYEEVSLFDELIAVEKANAGPSATPGDPERVTLNASTEPFQMPDPIRDYLEQAVPIVDSPWKELCGGLLSETRDVGINAIDLLILKIYQVTKTREFKIRAPAKPPEVDPRANHTEKKKALFKMSQALYGRAKSELAEKLLEGQDLLASAIYPDIGAVEQYYSGAFEQATPAEPSIRRLGRTPQGNMYRPILPEEVSAALANSKSHARGPDGLGLSDLKKVPANILAIILSAMAMWAHIPPSLRVNRTILIPKGDAGREEVANYRPITIASVLLRVANKIWADRLSDLPLHEAQKGFISQDGVLINSSVLQFIIKRHRKMCMPYTLLSLDLRKAFDSVPHSSILAGLDRLGVDPRVTGYVMANYADVRTRIELGGYCTRDIRIQRGVKQGDPMSPVLFNIVMDELLAGLDPSLGLKLGDCNISALAYADDIILLAPSRTEMLETLKACTRFFDRKGLALNVNKCSAIATARVPSKKKLFSITRPQFNIKGQPIRQLGVETVRYLGLKVGMMGVDKPDLKTLHLQLNRVAKSHLKPHQRLLILKQYLLPRWIHGLQNPLVSRKLLREGDRMVRSTVRKITHLPRTCASSFIHAAVSDGGLGVFSFAERIPAIMFKRLEKIRLTPGEIAGALYAATSPLRSKLAGFYRGMPVPRSVDSKEKTRDELQRSWSGNGIGHCRNHRGAQVWVDHPPTNWSGNTYCKALQLRGNLLPTHGNPANRSNDRWCRSGCGKVESLSHVLQGCHVTHHQRIARHDRVVSLFQSMSTKKGWNVLVEKRLCLDDGSIKIPDLILNREGVTIVCDVGVHWEGPRSLQTSYDYKQSVYNGEATKAAIMKLFPDTSLAVLPLILGARGTWCESNRLLWDCVGLGVADGSKIISDLIIGSIAIHSHFNRAVWAN